MMLIIRKTIALFAIFLVVPITAVVINWTWIPTSLNGSSKYLFIITETSSFPWAAILSFLFFLLFCFFLKVKSKKQIIQVLFILAFAILFGQAIKSVAKSYFGESRPFVLWMEDQFSVDDDYFYSLPRDDRERIIEEHVEPFTDVPNWLGEHWQDETGYSFPSGHTLFATTWAFLALVLLNFQRHAIIISCFVVWAVFIEMSRLSLGMHHPADLIVGSLLAWFIAIGSYYCARKWHIIT